VAPAVGVVSFQLSAVS